MALRPGRRDLLGRRCAEIAVDEVVAEMRANVVHHIRDLLIVEKAAEGGHPALASNDDGERIGRSLEEWVGRKRGIRARPDSALSLRHMASGAEGIVDSLAALVRDVAGATEVFELGLGRVEGAELRAGLAL